MSGGDAGGSVVLSAFTGWHVDVGILAVERVIDSSLQSAFASLPMSKRDDPPSKPPKKQGWWRKWLKRIGLVFLVLIGLVVIFHRTVIFEGTRYFVVRAAKQQNLNLDYQISGSIFSSLRIENLLGRPTESGPIKRLEIGEILLEYSLIGALREGLPALLDTVELHDVYVVIEPGEPLPKEKEEKEKQAFKFPGLFPERLVLKNINFQTVGDYGGFELKGLTFTLLPDEAGKLVVAKLEVPGVRTWNQLSAKTSYADRNMVLTDLSLSPEVRIERLNLDASELGEAVLGAELEGTAFDADFSVDLHVEDLNASNDLTVEATVDGLVLGKIWDYLNMEGPVEGTLDDLNLRFAGKPTEPKGWDADIALEASGLAAAGRDLGNVRGDLTIEDSRMEASVIDQLGEENKVELRASATLPETLEEFSKINADGALTADLKTVGQVAEGVEGGATARIDFQVKDQSLTADLNAASERLKIGENTVEGLNANVRVEKNLATEEGAPLFRDLKSKIDANVESISAGGVTADNVKVDAAVDDAKVSFNDVSLTKGDNQVRIEGDYELPEDLKSFDKQSFDADVSVDAPRLDQFVADGSDLGLSGGLKVEGKVTSKDGEIDGDFQIDGSDLKAKGLGMPETRGDLTIRNNEARLSDLTLVFDDENRVTLNGHVELAAPHAYGGTADVALSDLSVLNAVAPEPLGGALMAQWSGEGNVEENVHSGRADVELTNGRYGDRDQLAATVKAEYDWPTSVNVPVMKASAEEGDVSLSAQLAENRLSVTDVIARLGQLTVLTGNLSVPLHADQPGDLEKMIPNDEPVAVNLETGTLKLSEVFAALKLDDPPPVSGAVGVTVTASGTLDELTAAVNVQADRMQSSAAADVKPADVKLDVRLANDRAVVDGKITQPLVQPISVSGSVPVDVVQIRREGSLPPTTPLDLRVQMPRSSLGFVTSLVPVVRFIEGTAAIDLAVSGTIEKPAIAGDVEVDMPAARLSIDSLPPINDVTVRIDSDTERLTVSAFRGGLGGGTFGAEGTVTFGGVEQPVFDLLFGTRDALVMQDESVTARINSRIALTGPLDAAKVAGEVYVTKSRFYKDIDILPIGLPGRPAPQPPPAPTVTGITAPPLNDWTFDIAVKTADPFLVQGNLANGRILIDLRLLGTGARPTMAGEVRIEQLTTSLPFSELNIRNGVVFFQRTNPFVANFDIRGTSEIRNYDVTAYVYGNQNDPQVRFSSQPPLPQTDIVSLIATGVTSQDIAGNPSVLAGRAAILLFQKIQRSVFPSKNPSQQKTNVLSDVDINLGEIDAKTGRQSATVRFPLTDNFSLFGGVDVQGDFRGQVKYLIRFK